MASSASNSPQAISVELVVTGASQAVVVTAITNSATGLTGPIAPGELISIFGTGLGPSTATTFSANPATGMVDTTLAGTQVFFGSLAAPILYASATQVNVIAPYEIAGQSQVAIQVQYQDGASASQTVQVANASPGASTIDSSGTGAVVAVNQDGTMNGAASPAAKSSYMTGSVTGTVLKWLTQPISVTVGGELATVSFDGAAPTLAIDQLNIRLAPNTPSGAQPIVINVGGISSPSSVTLSVQ